MKKMNISLRDKNYPIYLGYPLSGIGIRFSGERFGSRVLVVTDTNVGRLYAGKVVHSLKIAGKAIKVMEIPAGERSKTFENVFNVIRECSEFRMDRSDTILALGGGVVTDLSGFAASIYLRGINYVSAPTSLLAQVDASVGGKTGVDLPWGKNLAGTFYQPVFVQMDFEALETLPDREISQGMAEVIKCGMIRSRGLFQFLEKVSPHDIRRHIPRVVAESVGIKKSVVEEDEKETRGLREILNFGHTLGHAVEINSLDKYNHGEAVAIGMACETFVAVRMKLCSGESLKRLKALITRFGLPVSAPGLDPGRVAHSLSYDKKVRHDRIFFVLPLRIGKVSVGVEVDPFFAVKALEDMA